MAGLFLDTARAENLGRQELSRFTSGVHGLRGRPLRFKFKVLAHLAGLWDRVKGKLTVRAWFRRLCEATDSILDSLIDAAGAIGAAIKEFKDALMALAPDAGDGEQAAERGRR